MKKFGKRGRPISKDPRTHYFNIRLNQKELDIVRSVSKKERKPISEIFRELFFEKYANNTSPNIEPVNEQKGEEL